MSQVIDRMPTTEGVGPRPRETKRTRRLMVAIIALGLLLGVAAGWSASLVLAPVVPSERSLDAQQARWEAAAEEASERAEAEAQRNDAQQRRWEANADHFAPGWRER